MSPEVERLSAELVDEIAENSRRPVIDPRTVPLRFHHLKAAGRSAAHCFQSFQSDGPKTASLALGSGVHAMLLGTPVAIWDRPAKTGEGKAKRSGKDWEAFKIEHSDAAILTGKERDRAKTVSSAILANSRAAAIVAAPGALHEDTILWNQGGRARRSTPDVRGPGFVAEIKTTRDASPGRFKYDVRRFAYHGQLADQCAAIEASTGRKPREAFIVAVETTAPYVTQVYRLTAKDLEMGERLVRLWFEAFRVAEDDDAWGGYSECIMDLDLPDDEEPEFTFADEDDKPTEEHA